MTKPGEIETAEVGDVEIKRTAPLNALQAPDRSTTTIIFIDAVEPKATLMQPPPHGDRSTLSRT